MEGCAGGEGRSFDAAVAGAIKSGWRTLCFFGSVAHLLNLDLDIVFVDTTSTYWELDVADELVDLAQAVDDDGVSRPVEAGVRAFGHSKTSRGSNCQAAVAVDLVKAVVSL